MRILTGIQPSGTLHWGNYFGMMQPAIGLQDEGEAFYFIADYHSLTSVCDPAALRKYIMGAVLDFLACGLDPLKTCFFLQSAIPAVTELTWILGTLTPMGLLERCHSYKDKIAHNLPATQGLFSYPVLMTADILLYQTDVVPVGRDQKQHIEVARDIAVKFNQKYEAVFKLPEASIQETTEIIPGLDGAKMSKSYGNTIEIFLTEKELYKKIMSIRTDSAPVDHPKPREGSTILALYKLFANSADYQQMEDDYQRGGVGYGEFKKRLFEAAWLFFKPMRARREELLADPVSIEQILKEGAARAQAVAQPTMDRVRSAIGLR
ncbi:MAG: tryptophan--tRNA ligase [Verrucomicrobia bacterium]|nr:MAG: tryptophan--tRNA ligase [Verrucomicrobiota bacterium]